MERASVSAPEGVVGSQESDTIRQDAYIHVAPFVKLIRTCGWSLVCEVSL